MQPDPIGFDGGINLYAYVLNDPVNHIDPLGLLVDVIYNRDTGNLIVTDRDTGMSISAPAQSGGKPYGDPIPFGQYEILDQARNPDFFRLDAVDNKQRNDVHDPSGRDHFRLHGPGNTIGCISCTDKEKWEKINDLIKKTSTVTVTDEAVPWWKFSAEEIKKYGDLNVCGGR